MLLLPAAARKGCGTYATFLRDAPTEAACIFLPELCTEELLCPPGGKASTRKKYLEDQAGRGKLSTLTRALL